MKIRKMIIKNFKSIENLSMENIPDLVVIAGSNGCGKTSIFEAIRIFKAIIGPYHSNELGIIQGELRNQLGNLVNLKANEAEISISFELSSDEISYLKNKGFQIDEELDKNNGLLGCSLKITKSGGSQILANSPSLQELLKHYDPTDEIGTIMYIPGVRELPAGDIGNITLTSDWMDQQKMESVGNARAKFQRLKQNFAMMFIYDQIQKTTNTANFIPQVKRIFRDFFYPKTFEGVDVDRSLTWHFPINLPGGTHDIDFLSSGEKEILMTFTEILKLKLTGSIILFDEPDLHLNAALERKVIGNLMRIVNSGNQIWVTTHSLEIIGTVPINNLFKMYSEPSSKNNQIELCSEKIDVFDLFKNLGASVGLQLISEKIVYVEGPSDVEILRTLYQERGDKISFIETKGVNGIVGLSHAVGDLLNEASKNESFLMIRDRDFLTQDKLDAVETKYNGRVHVWSKRTIENLLLDPEILYAIFSTLGISMKDSLEMQKMIKEVANKLKLSTTSEMIESKLYQLFNRSGFGMPTIETGDIVQEILSYVKPQRDDLVKKLQDTEIEKLIVTSKKDVDDNWKTNWMIICDGKKILQGLIDDYLTPKGKSMKISALRSLIVNQMKMKNKIPSEIDEFFKKHNIKIVTDLESIEQQNA